MVLTGRSLPRPGQYVTVHCTGYGKNKDMNLKFWSTKDPGQQPFTFRVGMGEVGLEDLFVVFLLLGSFSIIDSSWLFGR